MTITTDQVVQMAKEVGAEITRPLAPHMFSIQAYTFSEQELTALCNKVRNETLLEAAHEFQSAMYPVQTNTSIVITLRRMAGE